MTTIVISDSVLLLGASLILLAAIAYWVYKSILPKRVKQFLSQLQPFLRMSRAFDEHDLNGADLASIDLQLEKLGKGKWNKMRLKALQYINELGVALTKKQTVKLANLLQYQKEKVVLYEAVRLLCKNAESLNQEDLEIDRQAPSDDVIKRLKRWAPGLLIWAAEIVAFVLIQPLLDRLQINVVGAIAVLAIFVGILPSFRLAASWPSLFISMSIVVAIVSGCFWYLIEQKHSGFCDVSGRPFVKAGFKDFGMSIQYPLWLTTDEIDSNGAQGKQIIVEIEEGESSEFDLKCENDIVHFRNKSGDLDPFPIAVEESGTRCYELYIQVANRDTFNDYTTAVLTPTVYFPGQADFLSADEFTFEIALEPPIWRLFRDICFRITGFSGGGGGIFAVLWLLVPKNIRERVRKK
jgi:hypothetical protein